jgi:hypothetical protein
MTILTSLFCLLLGSSISLVQAQSHDGNSNCECYAVNSGGSMSYFANHRFYDFRFLANGSSDYRSAPAIISDSSNKGNTQDVLKGPSFTNDWSIQNWASTPSTENPVPLFNSPQNVYITQTNSSDLAEDNTAASTYLTLRTQRQSAFQSTSEVENTQNNLQYGSFRFRARVRGDAGACAGMFTFLNDKNEADIEILTKDSNGTYHYTNQPSVRKGDEIPGASIQKDNLPSWTEWRTHRLDWLPGITRSYIDGQLVAENKINVPKKPSFIDINMWSDGGVWTGNMTPGGEAQLQIQWIQASFNTTGSIKKRAIGKFNKIEWSDFELNSFSKRSSNRCSTVCTIDKTQYSGQPEITFTADVSKNIGHMPHIIIGFLFSFALVLMY